MAVGYNEMAHVDNNKIVSARFLDSKSTLASTVLFDAKGVAVEKDYAFVLSRSSVDSKYATLNVVLMDGTVTTLKITRNDYNSIFNTSDDFSIPYAYTTDGNGVSDLTKPNFSSDDNQASNLEIVRGYARQLRTGTVALYTDKTMTNLVTVLTATAPSPMRTTSGTWRTWTTAMRRLLSAPSPRTWAARLSWSSTATRTLSAPLHSEHPGRRVCRQCQHYCSACRELQYYREPGADPVCDRHRSRHSELRVVQER